MRTNHAKAPENKYAKNCKIGLLAKIGCFLYLLRRCVLQLAALAVRMADNVMSLK